ncbi:tripartite tricarboxylate transporter substrate-binding protein [Rhodobacteraceae bacterium F11138]|nr:tripartite tricarboxylate transporter substrate-binding protein [Rhodobacteraceae bacterium F11138]
MKSLLKTFATASVVALAATATVAQDWTPPGPIKMMVAFRAGGGADTHARLIAEELEKRHGWQIIPEEVAGRGGLNMAIALKDAPADGTVIGMAVSTVFTYVMEASPSAGLSLDDYTPLATTAAFQMGVVADASRGWKTIDDAFSAAQDGEQLSFGVAGPQLADMAYLLGEANGVDFNIVSLRGGRAVLDAITAGDVDMGFVAGIQGKGVAAGDLVNLASAISEPLDQSPDAPLLLDRGLEFPSNGRFIFAAPAGIPDEARQAISDAIIAVVSDPETEAGALVDRAFGGPATASGVELDAFMQDDLVSSRALLEAASQ